MYLRPGTLKEHSNRLLREAYRRTQKDIAAILLVDFKGDSPYDHEVSSMFEDAAIKPTRIHTFTDYGTSAVKRFYHAYFKTHRDAVEALEKSSVNNEGWDIFHSANVGDLVDGGF